MNISGIYWNAKMFKKKNPVNDHKKKKDDNKNFDEVLKEEEERKIGSIRKEQNPYK